MIKRYNITEHEQRLGFVDKTLALSSIESCDEYRIITYDNKGRMEDAYYKYMFSGVTWS